MVTKPFMATGGNLHVNVVAPRGRVRAEVLHADTMEPISSLTMDLCNGVTGDHLNALFTWKGDPSFQSNSPVRVRFELKNANLYSFWIEKPT